MKTRCPPGPPAPGPIRTLLGFSFRHLRHELSVVPYRGAAPAAQDLIAGQIDLMFDQVSSPLQYVRSGKTKAFAIASVTGSPWHRHSDGRRSGLTRLPHFRLACPGAPKGTPKDIIDKLNSAVVETLADPAVRTRLVDMGQEIPARDQQLPEALGDVHKAEIKNAGRLSRQQHQGGMT